MSDIYVIGLGPGDSRQMTPQAEEALNVCGVVAGYTAYIDLIREKLDGKRVIATGMMREIDRCVAAVEEALKGEKVAVVSSGDAGVYGMACLVLEKAAGKGLDVEVVPGITAACSGAAVLGAPLSHDFCTISLSDLLTPQEKIDARTRAAGMGDFCVALYNPMSKTRKDKLKRFCEILMEYKSGDTICGWVRNIGRPGESSAILTLRELADAQVDMFTTVFIGNSSTLVLDGKMVTPRGYERKEN